MSDAAPESPAVPRFDIRAHRRPEVPWCAYVGVALAIAQALFLVVVRILAVVWNFEDDVEARGDAILFLAGLLTLGIVPAVATIALGWSALRDAWGHRFRNAALGAAAFGAGCVFVVMWASRLINASIASVGWSEFGTFASQVFFWA